MRSTSVTPAAPEDAADEWERMHVLLASSMTRSLLGEARSQLRQGLGHDADARLLAQLWRAEDAIKAALSALEELDRLRSVR